jgi:hypothetical protein
MGTVIRFSRHFVQRWGERIGGLPSIEEINEIIAGSLRIIKQRSLWERVAGNVMIKHGSLSHYWCHRAGLILLVDEHTRTAVTVITPDMVDKYGAVNGEQQ